MRIKPVHSVVETILNNKYILEQMKKDFSKKKRTIIYEHTKVEITPKENKVDYKA